MARPDIILSAQRLDTATPVDRFQNALMQVQNRNLLNQQQETRALQNQLLQTNIGQAAASVQRQASADELLKLSQLNRSVGSMIENNNLLDAYKTVERLAPAIGFDAEDLGEFEQALRTSEGRNTLLNAMRQADSLVTAQQSGQLTATQRDRKDILAALEGAADNQGNLKPVEELTIGQRAAAIDAGLLPRATGSAAITTATTPDLTQQVAQSEAQIAAAEEGAVLDVQANKLPNVRKAIKLAEKEATAAGDAFTELNRLEAGYPALEEVANRMKQLAPIATSTISGKAFDTVSKQLGFGATRGAEARARYVALVNNQLLPLLKETFGAAFTESDREALMATMGDPDASAAEKTAAIDEMLAAKRREIETKRRTVEGIGSGSVSANDAVDEGMIIRNPSTGEQLILSNGQWVPYNG